MSFRIRLDIYKRGEDCWRNLEYRLINELQLASYPRHFSSQFGVVDSLPWATYELTTNLAHASPKLNLVFVKLDDALNKVIEWGVELHTSKHFDLRSKFEFKHRRGVNKACKRWFSAFRILLIFLFACCA